MKRVLIFTGHFYPRIGGIEKNIYEVSKRLAQKGIDIEIITSDSENAPSTEQIRGFHIYRLPSWHVLGGDYPIPSPSVIAFHIFLKIIRGNYDAVCTHARMFPISLLGLLTARLKGIPLIHVEHGIDHHITPNKMVRTVSKVYDHTLGSLIVTSASRVVGVSNAAADFLKHLGAKEVMIIPNGVDTEVFKRKGAKLKGELALNGTTIITFVGRLTYWKGVQELLRSFQEVQKDFAQVRLLIVGDGSYRNELEKLAGGSDKVLFLGQKSEQEVVEILNITDIFVLPSYIESFGLAMAEAGVMGIPVIVTNHGGGKEIIEDGKTGLLFQAGSIEDLSEKLRQLLVDEDLRRELGKNASIVFRDRFDWDKIAEEWARELVSVGKHNE